VYAPRSICSRVITVTLAGTLSSGSGAREPVTTLGEHPKSGHS
jgi:hypothetical protein